MVAWAPLLAAGASIVGGLLSGGGGSSSSQRIRPANRTEEQEYFWNNVYMPLIMQHYGMRPTGNTTTAGPIQTGWIPPSQQGLPSTGNLQVATPGPRMSVAGQADFGGGQGSPGAYEGLGGLGAYENTADAGFGGAGYDATGETNSGEYVAPVEGYPTQTEIDEANEKLVEYESTSDPIQDALDSMRFMDDYRRLAEQYQALGTDIRGRFDTMLGYVGEEYSRISGSYQEAGRSIRERVDGALGSIGSEYTRINQLYQEIPTRYYEALRAYETDNRPMPMQVGGQTINFRSPVRSRNILQAAEGAQRAYTSAAEGQRANLGTIAPAALNALMQEGQQQLQSVQGQANMLNTLGPSALQETLREGSLQGQLLGPQAGLITNQQQLATLPYNIYRDMVNDFMGLERARYGVAGETTTTSTSPIDWTAIGQSAGNIGQGLFGGGSSAPAQTTVNTQSGYTPLTLQGYGGSQTY